MQRDGVVFFVGAGLSKGLGYPLWEEFLKEVADQLDSNLWSKLRSLAKRDLSKVAERLAHSRNSQTAFRDIVQEQFSEVRLSRRIIKGAPATLARLARGPVITTNLDHVLETAFRQQGFPFRKVVWGDAARNVMNNAFMGTTLIKFHGDYEFSEDWVLASGQYDECYGPIGDLDGILASPSQLDQRPMLKLLSLVTKEIPLFFVGCSLRQDRTLEVLRRIAIQSDVQRSWALIESPLVSSEQDKLLGALDQCRIVPIWYPYGGHHLVDEFLKYMTGAKFSFGVAA
jgi:hypothetical protein